MNLNTNNIRVEPAIDFGRSNSDGKLLIVLRARCVKCCYAILPPSEDSLDSIQIPNATCPICNIVVADWQEINKLLHDAAARIAPLATAFALLAKVKPLLFLFDLVPKGIGHGVYYPPRETQYKYKSFK